MLTSWNLRGGFGSSRVEAWCIASGVPRSELVAWQVSTGCAALLNPETVAEVVCRRG
jgi:hypothetical protein